MRYCVSDLHGEYKLFCRLLDLIKFSNSDELIVCGDIIDKGTEPIRLAKLLFSMSNVHCIIGNHEYEFLKLYWSLMKNSPTNFDAVLERLRAYIRYDGNLLEWETVDCFENLPFYIEEKEFVCVHAGIPLDENKRLIPLCQATKEQLVYDRTFKEPSILPIDSKCVIFGHTPTNYITGKNNILMYSRMNAPKSISDYYKIHLDTGANQNGIMGCLCIDTMETYYVHRA